MERHHFEQSKLWLEGAKFIGNLEHFDKNKYTVAISMLIHSILKANDALTVKFLNTTARRHDEARKLFEELIKRNFIKSEYANYKDIIQDAVNNKAKAEYRASFFGKNDFEDMLRKAEKFLKMASIYF